MNQKVIGVDLGGTKILAGKVERDGITASARVEVPKGGSEEDVLLAMSGVIDQIIDDDIAAIGVGVPSIVDVENGIVFDVQNIPSWKEVHLKRLLEEKYGIPVHVNNDANCFALGEKYFGQGRDLSNMAGVIIGTGFAAGLILNDELYNGHNCGAGEFGMIPYLDHYYEYYCSGQFFQNFYRVDGSELFQKALDGDQSSISIFAEFGVHLGNAINTILYAVDPEIIILGGSVSKAFPYFKRTMWENISQFVYGKVIDRLTITVSKDPDIAILGAASLSYETLRKDRILESVNR